MPLYFSPVRSSLEPEVSGKMAHQANHEAVLYEDAKGSLAALEDDAREEMNHPVHRKFLEATRNRKILIYGLLVLAFICITCWEWKISSDLYEIFFPFAPWVPFAGCVAIAIFVSYCFGESLSDFSLSNSEASADHGEVQHVIKNLYARKTINWLFNPLTGGVLGLVFMFLIYMGSAYRVHLQEEAGNMVAGTGSFVVYLPVVLYAAEILLGIPTFYLMVWVCSWWRSRNLRSRLTRSRDAEHILRKSSVEKYMEHVRQLNDWNEWAVQQGRQPMALTPPNQQLRRLLRAEFGFDPFLEKNNDENPTQGTGGKPEPGTTPRAGDRHGSGPGKAADPIVDGHDQQIHDLLNLVDEQVRNQNRGL